MTWSSFLFRALNFTIWPLMQPCNTKRSPSAKKVFSLNKKAQNQMGETLFTLSLASPRSLGFTLGFFWLSWLLRGLEATTNCLGWQRPRRELHGVKSFLKRQNSSGASRERRAHKSVLHQVLNVTRPTVRAALANVIFTHGFYKGSLSEFAWHP